MSWRSPIRAWNEFFFKPQSPTPLALYRILYGLLVITDLALLHGDWFTWYGTNGLMRLETMRKMTPGIRLNVFLLMPQDDAWVQAFFWVFLLFAVLLTVGLLSRFSSIAVFLCLISLHNRNLYILNSGDTLLRVTGFFLMFAPTDAAISVDRLLRIWRGREGLEIDPISPWAQRMIQIQAALAYFSTFLWKMRGTEWIGGTAVYYTTRLLEFQRFPFPALENGIILKLLTWSTLFVEFALGVLIWFRRIRYWVLLMGVCLHLSIEYLMNIPLFQWIAMATYVTFIDPADLTRVWNWIRHRLVARLGNPADVIYEGNSARAARLADVLRAADVFGRLNFYDVNTCGKDTGWPTVLAPQSRIKLVIRANGRMYGTNKGLIAISRRVPVLWPLAPLSLVNGVRKHALRFAKAAK